ncbi:hypothetical protein [Vibrio paucivorans]|uniref:Uncharacterized protein n=1 Tax=Vibrio paucivorans TaxID=2829489 RepID=A0A9X3HSX0_9VIBR|nr:hypothetical protein [Vibrio paucivorans]MCW8335350.1 hypothetical protein [Vibrio paucivorans]
MEDAKRLTTKLDVREAYIGGEDLNWDALDMKVREVITDLTYVGVYTGSDDARGNTRKLVVPAIFEDLRASAHSKASRFRSVMSQDEIWITEFGVDPNRFNKRLSHLR